MTYTPFQWNAILAPERKWQDAYQGVEEAVKALFVGPWDWRATTAELVEALYPEAQARGPGITARKRIFSALEALSKHGLKDYWEYGEERTLKHSKRPIRPKIWRAPAKDPVKLRAQAIARELLTLDWDEVNYTIADIAEVLTILGGTE